MKRTTLSSQWQIEWYESLAEARPAWEGLAKSEDFFLSTDYLASLEALALPGVELGFAIFEHEQHGRFGLILQTFGFNPEQQMGKLDQNQQYGRWERLAESAKRILARVLRFRILTIGQLLLTGDHAIRGQHQLSDTELAKVIADGAEAIAKCWSGYIHGILLKDLPLQEHPRKEGYHPLPVQPNMVLHLRSEWNNFEDYLGAMSSKYRVRVRRARKKGAGIERRELTVADIQAHEEEMYAFFRQIATQSDFNAVELPADYFTRLAIDFSGRFKVWGYYDEGQFIGFKTAIYNGKELEAHFLGFDQSYNRSHQLYLNILYDLVEESLKANCQELVFSRTALEIKSSVGAEAETLYCWMKARVPLANGLVPIVAKFIAPLPEWEARHPFK